MNLHGCGIIVKPSNSSYFHQSCAKHLSQLVLLQQNFMVLTALSNYPVKPDETQQFWTQSESSQDVCITSDCDARLCWLKTEGSPAYRFLLKNCTCSWQEILFIRQQNHNGEDLYRSNIIWCQLGVWISSCTLVLSPGRMLWVTGLCWIGW